MIKITYECDETGQKMEVLVFMGEEDGEGGVKSEVKINFEPTVCDTTEDPLGMMTRVFKAVTRP